MFEEKGRAQGVRMAGQLDRAIAHVMDGAHAGGEGPGSGDGAVCEQLDMKQARVVELRMVSGGGGSASRKGGVTFFRAQAVSLIQASYTQLPMLALSRRPTRLPSALIVNAELVDAGGCVCVAVAVS